MTWRMRDRREAQGLLPTRELVDVEPHADRRFRTALGSPHAWRVEDMKRLHGLRHVSPLFLLILALMLTFNDADESRSIANSACSTCRSQSRSVVSRYPLKSANL